MEATEVEPVVVEVAEAVGRRREEVEAEEAEVAEAVDPHRRGEEEVEAEAADPGKAEAATRSSRPPRCSW